MHTPACHGVRYHHRHRYHRTSPPCPALLRHLNLHYYLPQLLLLLLLCHAPITTATAISISTRQQLHPLQGPFIRRYGITSCPDNIYFDTPPFNRTSSSSSSTSSSSTSSFSVSSIFINQQVCTSGDFTVTLSPAQAPSGGALAPFLSTTRGAGSPIVGLDITQRLVCPATFFDPRAYLVLFRPDIDVKVNWYDVYKRNDTVLQNATGSASFTFRGNVSYLVVNSVCLFSSMTKDEIDRQRPEACFPRSANVYVVEDEEDEEDEDEDEDEGECNGVGEELDKEEEEVDDKDKDNVEQHQRRRPRKRRRRRVRLQQHVRRKPITDLQVGDHVMVAPLNHNNLPTNLKSSSTSSSTSTPHHHHPPSFPHHHQPPNPTNNFNSSSSSPVIAWSHHDATTVAPFLEITTRSGHALYASHGHYIYANNMLLPARLVRVGMTMRLAFEPDSPVVAVEPIWRVGMYNPQTLHGDIVVNGFVVSTYTEAVRTPTIAHALMTPVRFCFVAGSMVVNRIFR